MAPHAGAAPAVDNHLNRVLSKVLVEIITASVGSRVRLRTGTRHVLLTTLKSGGRRRDRPRDDAHKHQMMSLAADQQAMIMFTSAAETAARSSTSSGREPTAILPGSAADGLNLSSSGACLARPSLTRMGRPPRPSSPTHQSGLFGSPADGVCDEAAQPSSSGPCVERSGRHAGL